MSWNSARQKAINSGGDLIVILNQNDQNFYENLIIDEIWIGLFQDLSSLITQNQRGLDMG